MTRKSAFPLLMLGLVLLPPILASSAVIEIPQPEATQSGAFKEMG